MSHTLANAAGAGMPWLSFALMTVGAWGLYGVFLHAGVMGMNGGPGGDPNARYKAFLWVGLAYFLTAVLAPLILLLVKGATWQMPGKGVGWSLLAGLVGAVGAFCVLLAFAARGKPAVVMSIIFAGAPIINAIVAMCWHPPAEGWGAINWRFLLGIALAAAGGALVTLYRPQ